MVAWVEDILDRDGTDFTACFAGLLFARYGLVDAWHSCQTGTIRALAKKGGANGEYLTRTASYGCGNVLCSQHGVSGFLYPLFFSLHCTK
jgi:hypothetical protein